VLYGLSRSSHPCHSGHFGDGVSRTRLASNLDPPDLSLPGSWDDRREPRHPASFLCLWGTRMRRAVLTPEGRSCLEALGVQVMDGPLVPTAVRARFFSHPAHSTLALFTREILVVKPSGGPSWDSEDCRDVRPGRKDLIGPVWVT
jgi:hypothetical protein